MKTTSKAKLAVFLFKHRKLLLPGAILLLALAVYLIFFR